MAMVEDLALFLRQDEFAEAGKLDGVDVVGQFDYAAADVLDTASRIPTYWLPAAATTTTTTTSLLVLAIGTFRVRAIDPDGAGACTLRLELQ